MQTVAAPAETVIGRPHWCNPSLVGGDSEGMTLVSFVITAEGAIEHPIISETSGNSDVDTASLKCVVPWRYHPALRDGIPVAVDWEAYIAWNPRTPPDVTQVIRQCAQSVSSDRKDAAAHEGTTTFSVRYENSKVASVSIAHSGGDASVDDAEAACLAAAVPKTRERVIVNNHVDYGRPVTVDVDLTLKASQKTSPKP